jgi:hypothetical protein
MPVAAPSAPRRRVKPDKRPVVGWELVRSCRLPDEMRSLNEYTHGFGPHSRSPRHWRDREVWWALLRCTEGLGIPEPHGDQKRKVDIIRIIHAGQREWDSENVYGGSVKAINDALKDLGWIKDDNPFWRELALLQIRWSDLGPKLVEEYRKKKFSTVISISKPVYAPEG